MDNEILVGSALKRNRNQLFLVSKAWTITTSDGSHEINGIPDRLLNSCNENSSRFDTDVIDLSNLGRAENRVLIEKSFVAMDQ